MGSLENVCSVYYSSSNPQFESLAFNILRDINRHEVGFVGEEVTNRHYTLNDFNFMAGQLKHRYVDTDNAYWHFYRSLEKIPGQTNPKEEWDAFGFDFAIDLDGDGEVDHAVRQTHEEAQKLLEYFEENDVQSRIKYSGRRGFHIEMPWEQIKYHFVPDDWPVVAADFAQFLIEKSGMDEEVVDMGLYKPRGLYRVGYSVAKDTPIIVDNEGSVERIQIQDLEQYDIQDSDITTPALSEDGEIEWRPINSIISHRPKEPLYRITTEKNYSVDVSSSHSVYVLTENGIESKETSEISEGDYLVKLNDFGPEQPRFDEEINLAEHISGSEIADTHFRIMIHNIQEEFWDEHYDDIKQMEGDNVWNWRYKNMIGLDAYLEMKERYDGIDEYFRNATLQYSGGTSETPLFLPVDEDLMYFLGYYAGDGHKSIDIRKHGRKNYTLNVSLNTDIYSDGRFDRLLKYLERISSNPTTHQNQGGVTTITVSNKILYHVFENMFCVGDDAYSKRVPGIVWSSSDRMKMSFLKGYLHSDGCRSEMSRNRRRITYTTSSEPMKNDISYLLSALGIRFSIYEIPPSERDFGTHVSKTKRGWTIKVMNGCDVQRILDTDPQTNMERYNQPNFLLEKYSVPDVLKRVSDQQHEVIQYISRKKQCSLSDVQENTDSYNKKQRYDRTIRVLEEKGIIKCDGDTLEITEKGNKAAESTNYTYLRGVVNNETTPHFRIKEIIENEDIPEDELETLNSVYKKGLEYVRVKDITQVDDYDGKLYDIEVEGHHNFVGGDAPLLLHNSIHPSTSSVALPLTGKQFRSFKEDFRTITQPTYVMRELKLRERHPVINHVDSDDGGLSNIIEEFKDEFDIEDKREEREEKELAERRKWEQKVDRIMDSYDSLPEEYQKRLERQMNGFNED